MSYWPKYCLEVFRLTINGQSLYTVHYLFSDSYFLGDVILVVKWDRSLWRHSKETRKSFGPSRTRLTVATTKVTDLHDWWNRKREPSSLSPVHPSYETNGSLLEDKTGNRTNERTNGWTFRDTDDRPSRDQWKWWKSLKVENPEVILDGKSLKVSVPLGKGLSLLFHCRIFDTILLESWVFLLPVRTVTLKRYTTLVPVMVPPLTYPSKEERSSKRKVQVRKKSIKVHSHGRKNIEKKYDLNDGLK